MEIEGTEKMIRMEIIEGNDAIEKIIIRGTRTTPSVIYDGHLRVEGYAHPLNINENFLSLYNEIYKRMSISSNDVTISFRLLTLNCLAKREMVRFIEGCLAINEQKNVEIRWGCSNDNNMLISFAEDIQEIFPGIKFTVFTF